MNQQLKPTNVRFVDRLLGGGTKPVGVYGILSPTGVGKSMLACMIATDSSTGGSVFDDTTSRPTGLWVWFDFHNQGPPCRERLVSHAARISRDQVWQQDLSVEDYESSYMKMLPQVDGQVMPAAERMRRATECINRQLLLVADEPDRCHAHERNRSRPSAKELKTGLDLGGCFLAQCSYERAQNGFFAKSWV